MQPHSPVASLSPASGGTPSAGATANLAITTSREDFRALAAEHRVVPVTRKVLADSETPLSAYRKLAANRPGTFLLSRPRTAGHGRGGPSSGRARRRR